MKKTLLSVKGNNKDEIWCTLNGNALELMAANLTALTHTIESLKTGQEKGERLLKMLLEDIEELFEINGITLKEKVEIGQNERNK